MQLHLYEKILSLYSTDHVFWGKEDFINLPRCLRIVFSMVLFSENPFVRWQEQDFHEVIIRSLSFRVKLLSNIKLRVTFSQQSASFMMMWVNIEGSDCCVWIRNDVLTLKISFFTLTKVERYSQKNVIQLINVSCWWKRSDTHEY